ncbi:hypothetical protein C7H19_25145, partial [Aphanothece hegewaldii CCALA 016]
AQIVVEVNSLVKSSQYSQSQTDLSVNLGGTTLNLVRRYDSLSHDEMGSFGQGWQLANLETDLQTNVPSTRQEYLGIFAAFEVGTRLYLTLPDSRRVGFTFAPVEQSITGLTYYTPAWVADAGVDYTLESAETLLTSAGSKFYDLVTAKPYHPSSPNEKAFTLTAPDGTLYHLNASGKVIEQVVSNGDRLFYSDSGITASSGETIRFIKDAMGRLTFITAPDGTKLVYSYDFDGQLISAQNLQLGTSTRYGYAEDKLILVTGEPGKVISYGATPVISHSSADLGSVSQFTGSVINGFVNERSLYSFSLRDSELSSTATGTVLLSVDVQGSALLPKIVGITPIATQTNVQSAFALFAMQQSGLNLLELNGLGDVQFKLSIAGDLNHDGQVDGVDLQLLSSAISGGNYLGDVDVNRDGVLSGADLQILGSNYGFSANRAPVVNGTSVLTHQDLGVSIPVGTLASDPEGDAIFWKMVNPVNGTVILREDGQTAWFKPILGYTGLASFELMASDGFSAS